MRKIFLPVCILTFAVLALPAFAATPAAASSPIACAGGTAAGTPPVEGQEPLFLSGCTDCTPCVDDSQCGTGTCTPYIQAPILCEGDEVCYLPSPVCSLSCTSCTSSSQCPSGESCIPVQQAFCIPEEVCDTVFPRKVCVC